jgi:hypothetical protein
MIMRITITRPAMYMHVNTQLIDDADILPERSAAGAARIECVQHSA